MPNTRAQSPPSRSARQFLGIGRAAVRVPHHVVAPPPKWFQCTSNSCSWVKPGSFQRMEGTCGLVWNSRTRNHERSYSLSCLYIYIQLTPFSSTPVEFGIRSKLVKERGKNRGGVERGPSAREDGEDWTTSLVDLGRFSAPGDHKRHSE